MLNLNRQKLSMSAVLALVAVIAYSIFGPDRGTPAPKDGALDFAANVNICLLLTDNIKKFIPPTDSLDALLKENLELVGSTFIEVESSKLEFAKSDFSWEEQRDKDKFILTAKGWNIKVSARLKTKELESKDWVYITLGKELQETLKEAGVSLYFNSNEFEKRDQPFQKASNKLVVVEFTHTSIFTKFLLIVLAWFVVTLLFYNLKLG